MAELTPENAGFYSQLMARKFADAQHSSDSKDSSPSNNSVTGGGHQPALLKPEEIEKSEVVDDVSTAMYPFQESNLKLRVNSKTYTPADLYSASQKILVHRWTYQQVCDYYGWTIPQTTLHRAVKLQEAGKAPKRVGRPTKLTTEEEAWLAQWCTFCYLLGVPARRGRVMRKAAQILFARGDRFDTRSGMPTYHWWQRFARDHGLAIKPASYMSRQTAASLTREQLDDFYDVLFNAMLEYKIKPALLWAADETGFCRNKGKTGVVAPLHARKVKLVGAEPREHVTLMSCGSAIGQRTDIFLLMKGQGKKITRWPLEGAPSSSAICYTPKAWANQQSFFLWIRWFAWQVDSLQPELRSNNEWVLLLVDGHKSRFNPDMLQWAADHRILLLCYPPNATSILQSADVSLHGPLKRKAEALWADNFHDMGAVSLHDFVAKVVYPAWDSVYTPANIKAGFEKTGAWPQNRIAISSDKLRPADLFREEKLSLAEFVQSQRENKEPQATMPQMKDPAPYLGDVLGVPQSQDPKKEGAKPAHGATLINTKEGIAKARLAAAKSAARKQGKGGRKRKAEANAADGGAAAKKGAKRRRGGGAGSANAADGDGKDAAGEKRADKPKRSGRGRSNKRGRGRGRGRRRAQKDRAESDMEESAESGDGGSDEEEADLTEKSDTDVTDWHGSDSEASSEDELGSASSNSAASNSQSSSSHDQPMVGESKSDGKQSLTARSESMLDSLELCSCGYGASGDDAVCCMGCGQLRHKRCISTSRNRKVNFSDWYCSNCRGRVVKERQ